MPTKHNKLRYQSAPKDRPTLTLSGRVFLQYADDEAIGTAQKGDVLFYPSVEALNTIRQGEYTRSGYSGYFKLDIYDGREWKPLLPQGIFEKREQYFSKSERSLDTYVLCSETVKALAGTQAERTYREHYQVVNNVQ